MLGRKLFVSLSKSDTVEVRNFKSYMKLTQLQDEEENTHNTGNVRFRTGSANVME